MHASTETGPAINHTITHLGMRSGVNIGNFACGNPEDGTDVTEIDREISMVAMAAATAVANISAVCAVQGTGRINTEGSAMATARAEAYGRAVTSVFAENNACPNCTAVVEALVQTSQLVIAEATASAWIQVCLFTSISACLGQLPNRRAKSSMNGCGYDCISRCIPIHPDAWYWADGSEQLDVSGVSD